MRITIGQLKKIIREVASDASKTKEFEFTGQIQSFKKGDKEEISKILKSKGVKGGKVNVKKENNGTLTLNTADGRKFTLNISDIDDSDKSGNKPGQKSGSKSPQKM